MAEYCVNSLKHTMLCSQALPVVLKVTTYSTQTVHFVLTNIVTVDKCCVSSLKLNLNYLKFELESTLTHCAMLC